MAQSKAAAGSRLPIRRGLDEAEAAIYIGVGPTKFREMVGDGRMPRPRLIDSRRVWDVDELDSYFRALPQEGERQTSKGSNPWHK